MKDVKSVVDVDADDDVDDDDDEDVEMSMAVDCRVASSREMGGATSNFSRGVGGQLRVAKWGGEREWRNGPGAR